MLALLRTDIRSVSEADSEPSQTSKMEDAINYLLIIDLLTQNLTRNPRTARVCFSCSER